MPSPDHRAPASLRDVAESQPCGENANSAEAFRFQNATVGRPLRKSVVTITRVPQARSAVRVLHAARAVRGLHLVNRVGTTPLSFRLGDAIHAVDWLDNRNPHRRALGSQRNPPAGRQRPGPTRLGVETNTGWVGAFFATPATTGCSTRLASVDRGQSRNSAGDSRPIGPPGDHSAGPPPPARIGSRLQSQAKTPPPRADSPSLIPTPPCRNGSPKTRLIHGQTAGALPACQGVQRQTPTETSLGKPAVALRSPAIRFFTSVTSQRPGQRFSFQGANLPRRR